MPLLLDIFCGKGGWTKAAQSLGWETIGIDIIDHGYPSRLHIARCPLPLVEIEKFEADLIVASPPCEEYARFHLPWINKIGPVDETLLRWSISLVPQVSAPMIVECSRFAGWHVPGWRWIKPYCLWGDVPALLPNIKHRKDSQKSHSSTPNEVRKAEAAEICYDLARWLIETAPRKKP